jgi:hypothetical protein
MAAPDQKRMVHMRLEAALLRQLDDFRFKHRFESRSQTARWLLEWALSKKPSPMKAE